MEDGRLLAGAHSSKDEHHLYYCTSADGGYTWSEQKKAHLDKKIRDPQLAYIGGQYYLHGRSGHHGEGSRRFVLYQSKDGENWSEGIIVSGLAKGLDGYNYNCVIHRDDQSSEELMVLYSIMYESEHSEHPGHDTNSYVFFIRPDDDAAR